MLGTTSPETIESGAHPWVSGVVSKGPAVLVVGGYRCGTTSIFNHLAEHPEVNPSVIKEPGFFFSNRIRQQPSVYPKGHEIWAYRSLFRRPPPARVWLEGTANYLNDPGAAQRIKRALPNAKIIIALREPVAKLLSWYKFSLMREWQDPAESFSQWVDEQLADQRPLQQRPYHLQALAHGFYSDYVREYIEVFGQERVKLVWFDDLMGDTLGVMRELCGFAGVDPEYMSDLNFTIQNEAMQVKRRRAFNLYRKLHRAFFRLFSSFPRVQHELRVWLFAYLEPRFLWLFTGPAESVEMPSALRVKLMALYQQDIPALESLVGSAPPWKAEYDQLLSQAMPVPGEVPSLENLQLR